MSSRPQVATMRTSGTSVSVTGVPSGGSSRFSLSPAKNAIDRPSGDQMTVRAPSVPATGRASTDDIGLIQTRWSPLASSATYASCDPSGDSAMDGASTVSLNAPPGGGAIGNLMTRAGAARDVSG